MNHFPDQPTTSQLSARARGLVLAAVLVALPASLAAQESGTLGACHDLADPTERLACYDRVSGRSAETAAAEAAAAESTASPTSPASTASPAPQGINEIAIAPPTRPSLLDGPWGLNEDSRRYWYGLYRPNYLLPVRYTNRVNEDPFSPIFGVSPQDDIELDSVESKFQVSLKFRVWTTDDRRWSVWGAYTQQNQWQVYNGDISRPFRETNYEPELFVTWRPDLEAAGWRWRLLSFGYNHESNGQVDPISRSWDRLFVEAGVERNNFALMGRFWTRISEPADEDDNPDITDYLGHGELTGFYRTGKHSLRLMLRGNLDTGKGAAEFSWYTPPLLGPLRGYVQLFSGYGESLIDYNWNQTTLGVGIVLNDGL